MTDLMILSLDPSINKTGWTALDSKGPVLLNHGTFKTQGGKNDGLVERLESIVTPKFHRILNDFDCEECHVVLELPDSWQRSGDTGTKNAGSMHKLLFACGWYAAMLKRELWSRDIYVSKTVDVTVSKWKGKTSKDRTRHIVEGVLQPRRKMNEHEVDSAGLALWYEARLRMQRAMSKC